jgi:hypothetical protein
MVVTAFSNCSSVNGQLTKCPQRSDFRHIGSLRGGGGMNAITRPPAGMAAIHGVVQAAASTNN